MEGRSHIKEGRWTPEEDEMLKQYIFEHGPRDWNKVGKLLNRRGKSCHARWNNYLNPNIKLGNFSPVEDAWITQLYSTHQGSRLWTAIAARLPGRTGNEIKNYWNTHLKKRLPPHLIHKQDHHPYTTQPMPTIRNELSPARQNYAGPSWDVPASSFSSAAVATPAGFCTAPSRDTVTRSRHHTGQSRDIAAVAVAGGCTGPSGDTVKRICTGPSRDLAAVGPAGVCTGLSWDIAVDAPAGVCTGPSWMIVNDSWSESFEIQHAPPASSSAAVAVAGIRIGTSWDISASSSAAVFAGGEKPITWPHELELVVQGSRAPTSLSTASTEEKPQFDLVREEDIFGASRPQAAPVSPSTATGVEEMINEYLAKDDAGGTNEILVYESRGIPTI